jgi:hypothetical protein
MRIIVADWETFFDSKDYTLKRMTTENYIRDPRFEAHGVAILQPDAVIPRPVWLRPNEFRNWAATIDWSDVFLIHHHAQFDGLIESHHFGINPKAYGCTLAMARLLLGNHLSVSLDSVRKHFGMALKTTPYGLFDGKHWHELDSYAQAKVAEGACDEVASIWTIFQYLAKDFPAEEYAVVDTTIRMFTQPALVADVELLAQIWEDEEKKKSTQMAELGVTEAQLQSADYFAGLLRAEGVEPEQKEGKKGSIYAFAKTDDFMRELLESDDDRVRALAEIRLGVKSTYMQTRAETWGYMGSRGPMCVYLSYAGAGTLRPSGGDKANFLNMKRQSQLRKTLKAPEGFLLLPVDSSQIECIAQGQRVLTDRGWIAIELVRDNDFVWDGTTWVNHDGVICKGEQKVITVDSLTATPDHIIYPEQYPNGITLGAFARIGYGFATSRRANAIRETPLRCSSVSRIQNIWGPWNSVLLSNCERRGSVDIDQSLPSNIRKCGDRSQRQRRALRTWKFEIINAARKCQQSLYDFLGAVWRWSLSHAGFQTGTSRMWLWAGCNQSTGRERLDWRADHLSISARIKKNDMAQASQIGIQTSSRFETKKAKVYDILNAGPRHRFTVEGVVVSNCRVLHYLAGGPDEPVIQKFRNHEDPYVDLASRFYGEQIYKPKAGDPHKEEMEAKRGMGKQGRLMCGYGAGSEQFKKTAKNGLYGPPVDIPIEEAERFVTLYRADNPSITARQTGYWAQCNKMLARLAGGPPVDWGPLHVRDHRIYLPNGCPMIYDTLEFYRPTAEEQEELKPYEWDGFWRVKTRRGWKKMWGSKLTQNICEAVSRVIVTQAMNRITALGYRVLNHPYDELLCLIPRDGKEQWHRERCIAEMVCPVPWLPGLPLDCEGELGERYSK